MGGSELGEPDKKREPEKRKELKETIGSGEPMKLTPWAVASGSEQPKEKWKGQPKRTLKKIEDRVRGCGRLQLQRMDLGVRINGELKKEQGAIKLS